MHVTELPDSPIAHGTPSDGMAYDIFQMYKEVLVFLHNGSKTVNKPSIIISNNSPMSQ